MNAIQVISKQMDLNTRFFRNVLQGISDEDGLQRPGENANHIRWIAGHMVVSRFRLATRFKLTTEPYPYFDRYVLKDVPPPNAKPLDPGVEYPRLAEALRYWDLYSQGLTAALAALPEEQLMAETAVSTPIGDPTVAGGLTFLLSHEAYHIGQMSMIRKALGYNAMLLK